MLPRERRLTSRRFQEVYERGDVRSGRLVVLRVLPRPEGPSRWGFAVGRKLVPSAPDRARWRRRLRQVVVSMNCNAVDCVITLRAAAMRASLDDIGSEVRALASNGATGADPSE